MANTTIKLKKSGTLGNSPTDLNLGEVAINYADGKLYYKNSVNSITAIENQSTFKTINVNSDLILASSPTDILTILPGTNITLTACTVSKTITINSSGGGGGSGPDQYARDTANAAFVQANDANQYANASYGRANAAYIQANAAFDQANNKTYTFYQNTAPSTSNAHDLWVHSDTGFVYENFGTTSSPIWAEFGPSGNSTVSSAGVRFSDNTVQTTAAAPLNYSTSGYAQANAANNLATSAYDQANAANNLATSAYDQANAAYIKANTSTAFSANLSTDQSGLTNSTYTKILFDTEQFDTGNYFTSNKFTPNIAGYYLITLTVSGGATTTLTRVIGVVYKNGSLYQMTADAPPGGTLLGSGSGSVIVFMNGTTDFIEGYGFITGTGTLRFEADHTRITGVLVQAT